VLRLLAVEAALPHAELFGERLQIAVAVAHAVEAVVG
jgi:hypothetical protein